MADKITNEVQGRAIKEVMDYRTEAENLTKEHRDRMLRIYRSYKTFRESQSGYMAANRMRTDFKVNKAHEVIEKVLVRIIGKDPKWIVTPRDMTAFMDGDDSFIETVDENGNPQRDFSQKTKDKSAEYSAAVQDYLTYIFDEYNQRERFKILAKNMLVYGKAYAKPVWKYEIARISNPAQTIKEIDQFIDDQDEEVEGVVVKGKVEEKVIGQYPTIDVISWTDIFYDPRYVFLNERPAMVEVVDGVRYSQLLKDKDDYINLDKLKEMIDIDTDLDPDQYKRRMMQISGIMNIDPKVLKNGSLQINKYYGLFSPSGDIKSEKMYEICTVNDTLCIKIKEITCQPIQEVKCFDDPETAFATGFVEPILGLQEEMNWKKNSASEYINQMLTRRFIWSPMSGINPKDMMNPIVATTKDGQTALNNIPELKLSEINSSFFQEENDIERQIQAMTFTVDTSNPRSENALTNTATGARIKFFESNSVLDEVRKTFEKFLERIAYSLLMMTFENLDKNIVFKKQGTEEYWNVNKEFLRNAVQKYSVKVEANSSSFDSIETKRENALALLNGSLMLKNAGVNIKLEPIAKEYYETFEKADPSKYIGGPSPMQAMADIGAINTQPPRNNMINSEAANLTEEVAGGSLQSFIPR